MLVLLKRAVLLLLIFPLAACAESDKYQEGDHYVQLSKPVATANADKVEVLELFWYGCPHCYALEPSLNKWVAEAPDYVEFKRMPGLMASSWLDHGKAYYAAEVLGVVDKTHEALFTAIHRYGQQLADQASLAGFYASQGVNEDEFNKVFSSFAVKSKINQAKAKQRNYRASGVPAIIVNGKYRVSTTMKAGPQGLFDVVDFLVEKERSARP